MNHFELESLYRHLDELDPCPRQGSEYQNIKSCFREVLEVIMLEQPDWAAQAQPLLNASDTSLRDWLKALLAGEELESELLQFAMEQTLRRYWKTAGQKIEDGPENDVCPVCGARVDVAYLDKDGFRYAVCSRCDSQWMIPRILCLRCGEKQAKQLEYYPYEKGYRLYHCKTCEGLLPAVDLRESGKLDLPKLRAAASEMQALFEEQLIAEE
ncbi:hypothetical protein [Oceanithermus sp.]